MWDLLLSADYMAPDPDAMAETLTKALGLPPSKPGFRQDFENHHYIAHFLRIHPSLAVAPTRFEPQSHVEKPLPPSDPIFGDFLESLSAFQGHHRPIKSHSNVMAVSDIEELMDRLVRRRVPFRVAPWSPQMPFDRLWIGVTADQPLYRPDWDGGLMVEAIPTAPLQLPEAAFSDTPAQPKDPAEGEMIRMVNRAYIVEDLGTVLALLEANLGIETSEPITSHDDEGFLRARIRYSITNSATLDLLQPTHCRGRVGRYFTTWGRGPYYARITVNGLDAKADDLASRGTTFDFVEETSAAPRRIAVDPAAVNGAEIEFIDAAT